MNIMIVIQVVYAQGISLLYDINLGELMLMYFKHAKNSPCAYIFDEVLLHSF
jgi:hypothetical protein